MWFFFPLDKSRRLALDFPNCSAEILLIKINGFVICLALSAKLPYVLVAP